MYRFRRGTSNRIVIINKIAGSLSDENQSQPQHMLLIRNKDITDCRAFGNVHRLRRFYQLCIR
jgi:hypothetical protein